LFADPAAAEVVAPNCIRWPARAPSDIAAMAAWLASDEAGFVSGQLFTVDGGLLARSPASPD
jgi:NAD(P)-dependent dehydrogenase (short-subunit alcohol dehydrogenase family)